MSFKVSAEIFEMLLGDYFWKAVGTVDTAGAERNNWCTISAVYMQYNVCVFEGGVQGLV